MGIEFSLLMMSLLFLSNVFSHGSLHFDISLPLHISSLDLKDHMKSVGHILRADILEGPEGRSRGCGIVEYAEPRDAAKAVQTLNDSELNGRRILVREDRESVKVSAYLLIIFLLITHLI